MKNKTLDLKKGDTPVRACEALVIEPAQSWQRLQHAKEFFFEDLEQQMKDSQYDPSLEGIDSDLMEELLGEDAKRELEAIKEMTRLLEEAGYLHLPRSRRGGCRRYRRGLGLRQRDAAGHDRDPRLSSDCLQTRHHVAEIGRQLCECMNEGEDDHRRPRCPHGNRSEQQSP